jgi:hypothetical protein
MVEGNSMLMSKVGKYKNKILEKEEPGDKHL